VDTSTQNANENFYKISPEEIKKAKKIFNDELKSRFEYIPVSVFVLLSDNKIIYKNELCKKFYPRIKIGSRFSNYGDINVNDISYSIVDFYGSTVSLINYKIDYNGFVFHIICEMGNFLFDEKVVTEVMKYEKDFAIMISSAIEQINCFSEDTLAFKKYIKHLGDGVNRLKLCQKIMTNFTGISKNYESTGVFSHSLSSLIRLVKKCANNELKSMDITFDDYADICSSSLLNFEDFSRILIYLLNFLVLYSGSNKISIFVQDGLEYNEIIIKCDDRLNLKKTFKSMFDAKSDDYIINKDFILFSPLFSAIKLSNKYGHKIDLFSNGKDISLTIKVKCSNEIPEMILRNDNMDMISFISSVFKNEYISIQDFDAFLSFFIK